MSDEAADRELQNVSQAGEDPAGTRSAQDDIVRVIAGLAAQPLDQPNVERMRRALAAEPASSVRAAFRRLTGASRQQRLVALLPEPRPASPCLQLAAGGAW